MYAKRGRGDTETPTPPPGIPFPTPSTSGAREGEGRVSEDEQEEEFHDADEAAPVVPVVPVIMSFDTAHAADDGEVYSRADKVKVPYDSRDPVYWLRRLEIRMQAANIKSQWWKIITFETNLPSDIGHQLKDLFAKEENTDAKIYKTCKSKN